MKKIFCLFCLSFLLTSCGNSDESLISKIQDEVKNMNMNTNSDTQGTLSTTDLSALSPENNNMNIAVAIPVQAAKSLVMNRNTKAQFEIISADMDYQNKNPLFKKNVAEEYQLVRLVVRVTGESTDPFLFDSLNFSLDTPLQKTILESELGQAREVQDHMVQQVQVLNGKSVQGALYFEVAKNLQKKDLVLSYESLTEQRESKEYKIPLGAE